MHLFRNINSPYVPAPMSAGTNLGIVDVAKRNDAYLFAGTPIGKEDGYASLRNAIVALQRLTAGDKPAGFVIEDKGKFFTQTLETAAGARDAHRGYALGRSWQDERAIRVLPNVLAVVDGAAMVRNDNAYSQISPRALWLRRVFNS
jgi:hypothetical protein